MAEQYALIGKHIPNVGGVRERQLAMGQLKFTRDIYPEDLLWIKILRSPLAHANIVSIDASAALKLPGVIDVLSYKNATKALFTDETYLSFYPDFCNDSLVFNQEVRWEGEEVAAVLAESSDIAEEALKLIKVEYLQLPVVTDVLEAVKSGSALVHSEKTSNIGPTSAKKAGDPETAFKNADMVVDLTVDAQNDMHNLMEQQTFVFQWGSDNDLEIWASTQSTYWPSYRLWKYLGIPTRTLCSRTGTGMGQKYGRGGMKGVFIGAMFAAKHRSRPIRLELGSRENNIGTNKQSRYYCLARSGVLKDGTITAQYYNLVQDQGAYQNYSDMTTPLGGTYTILYNTAVNQSDAKSVYTNDLPNCPQRGIGGHQSIIIQEVHMDYVAEKLNMDPLDLRLKNKDQTNVTAESLQEVIRQGSTAIDWKTKWKGWNSPVLINGSKKRGIGVACGRVGGGLGGAGGAVVVNFDGTVTVLSNGMDMGQGLHDAQRIAVAEILGMALERVHGRIPCDSKTAPYSAETTASRGAVINVSAVSLAADDAKAQLFALAAPVLGAKPEELEAKEGFIRVVASPDKKMTVEAAVRMLPSMTIIGKGSFVANPPSRLGANAVFAEVDVDTDTGELKVIQLVSVQDVGRAISIDNVEKQIDSGAIYGLSYATAGMVKDPLTGVHLNADMLYYPIPDLLNIPTITPNVVQFPLPLSYWGQMGIGEPVACTIAPAIGNAVRNAIGARITEYPITSDRILKALGKG